MVDGRTRTGKIVNRIKGGQVPRAQVPAPNMQIMGDMSLPNHSGDHSVGRVLTTPTTDYEITNKAYVDSNDFWQKVGAVLSPKTVGDNIATQNTITSIDSYLTLDTLDLNGGAFLSSVDWGSADVTTTGVITTPTIQKSGTTSVLDIQPDAVGSGWVSGTNYQSGPGAIFFKNATTYSGTHTTSQATVNENPWIEIWGSTSSGAKYGTIGINDYNEVRHGGTVGRSFFVNGIGFETEMQVGSNVAFGIYKNTIQGSSRQIPILYVNDAGNTDPTTIFSTYTRRALNFGMTDSSQPKTWFHDGSATNTHMIGIWHDGTDGIIEPRLGIVKVNSAVEVNDKSKMTAIGGFAIKITNKTGSNTVAGQLVKADTATNDAVVLAAAGDVECFGVFLDSGVSDGSEAWVVVSGIADVAFDDNVASVRGNWVSTGVLAGYAATSTSPAVAPTHFEEIGHCIETVAAGGAGTHILARCVLHFN